MTKCHKLLCMFFFSVSFSLLSQCNCLSIDEHPNWDLLPKGEECGFGALSDRIIGGKTAALGQFPWMAQLGYQLMRPRPTIYYLCGGSVISRWYVLTANHCLRYGMIESIKQVRVGENFLNKNPDCDHNVCAPQVQDILIKKLIQFGETADVSLMTQGDIALIRLATPIKFHDFAVPICLPKGNLAQSLKIGDPMEVAGWGSISPKTNRLPTRLMYVKMPLVDLKICQKTFSDNFINQSHICVGVGKGKDSCVGDSGGPLMAPVAVDGLPPRYFLFGLVSYGMKWCGVAAAVYTNVTDYMPWILDNLE